MAEVPLFVLGNWQGLEIWDNSNVIVGYKVRVTYTNGQMLSFTLQVGGSIVLMLSDQTTNFGNPGDNLDTTLRLFSPSLPFPPPIIPTAPYTGNFSAAVVSPTKIRLDLGGNLTILTAVKRHTVIQLTGQVATPRLALTGSNAALTVLGTYIPVVQQVPPGQPVVAQQPVRPDKSAAEIAEFDPDLEATVDPARYAEYSSLRQAVSN